MGHALCWPFFVALPLSLAGAEQRSGKIHGTVTDPAGSPVTAGTISLYEGAMTSATVRTRNTTFQVDGTGEYKGEVTAGIVHAGFPGSDNAEE